MRLFEYLSGGLLFYFYEDLLIEGGELIVTGIVSPEGALATRQGFVCVCGRHAVEGCPRCLPFQLGLIRLHALLIRRRLVRLVLLLPLRLAIPRLLKLLRLA